MKRIVLWGAVALVACSSPMPMPDAGDLSDAGDMPDAGGPPAVLALAPGEVAEVAIGAANIGTVQLATEAGTERFIVTLASTQLSSFGASYDYSLWVDATTTPTGAQRVDGCSIDAGAWANVMIQPETPPSGTGASVGDMRMLQVPKRVGSETVPMQAIRVSEHAVVWADVSTTHPANLDGGFVDAFLGDFEDKILPRERTVFGMESDLDHDGHIGIVFTPLTYDTAVAFFTQCDLEQTQGCSSYNGGEFLYVTPPDAIMPPYNTPNAMKEVLAHECSHLIHFNRKVLRNQLTDWNDSSYMIEGVGGFAQDAVGPQAGNLHVAQAGLDLINDFSLGQTLVDNAQYDATPKRDGILRGGSYLFVRYLYDRGGGDVLTADAGVTPAGGTAFLHALLESHDTMATALPKLTGATVEDVAADFYTTLAMSNREQTDGGVQPANGCFAYLPATTDPVWSRQRGADMYVKFPGGQLQGPATQDALNPDRKMRAGGVEYLSLSATAGQPVLGLNVSVDPAAKVRVRVGRIK